MHPLHRLVLVLWDSKSKGAVHTGHILFFVWCIPFDIRCGIFLVYISKLWSYMPNPWNMMHKETKLQFWKLIYVHTLNNRINTHTHIDQYQLKIKINGPIKWIWGWDEHIYILQQWVELWDFCLILVLCERPWNVSVQDTQSCTHTNTVSNDKTNSCENY